MLAGLISGTGPGSNLGRGTKLGQVNSGMHAIGLISWAVKLSPSSINLVSA